MITLDYGEGRGFQMVTSMMNFSRVGLHHYHILPDVAWPAARRQNAPEGPNMKHILVAT